jgi:putative endopeptidase
VESQLKARPIADWKTYLRWHAAHNRAPYLSSAFVQEDFEFYSKYLRGVKEQQPRWKRCVRLVDRDLGEALGQVFVAKTFTPATKAQALAMTKEIERPWRTTSPAPWMGDATRKQALEKLHAMVNKIGYPGQVARLQRADASRPAISPATCCAPSSSNPAPVGQDRQAGGPHRVA